MNPQILSIIIAILLIYLGFSLWGLISIKNKKVNLGPWGEFTGNTAIVIGIGQFLIGMIGFIAAIINFFA